MIVTCVALHLLAGRARQPPTTREKLAALAPAGNGIDKQAGEENRWRRRTREPVTGTVLSGGVDSPAEPIPPRLVCRTCSRYPARPCVWARFRGFVLAIAARCRRFMRCTPGPIGLF